MVLFHHVVRRERKLHPTQLGLAVNLSPSTTCLPYNILRYKTSHSGSYKADESITDGSTDRKSPSVRSPACKIRRCLIAGTRCMKPHTSKQTHTSTQPHAQGPPCLFLFLYFDQACSRSLSVFFFFFSLFRAFENDQCTSSPFLKPDTPGCEHVAEAMYICFHETRRSSPNA